MALKKQHFAEAEAALSNELPVHDNCNIALMLSHVTGLRIAEYFSSRKYENVVAVYFEEQSEYSEDICEKLGVSKDRVFYGKKIINSSAHKDWLKDQEVDFVITVYWPWLLGSEYLSVVRDSVNFHPALLPVNRGWYPHVHSIIDGSPAGVTLHKIAEGADEGDVWVQKEINIPLQTSAQDIYLVLQTELLDLFVANWVGISTGSVEATPQDSSKAVYHPKSELNDLDKIEIDDLSARQLFNLLRARTFGNRGFAYLEIGEQKYYLNLRISEDTAFNDDV